MKPTQITELFANIKGTFVSFFSILMFVALGVGIFLGIIWSGPALQNAADRTFEESNFHSFQVYFPYGLTDDDLKKLSEVEGVTSIEPARQSYQTLVVDGRNKTVKVQSLGSDIDTPLVVEGELPTKANEIALHVKSASTLGLGVGDLVTFEEDEDEDSSNNTSSKDKEDSSASKDSDGMKYLNGRTYKVTALINSPEYLAYMMATYGTAPTSSGNVNLLAWVPNAAFDASAFDDGYPVVNVRCESLDGKSMFSDEYKSASSSIEERISELGDTLATARYDDLHGQARQKVDDAKKDIADGEDKIKDGEDKIAQAKQDIADGERKVSDGERDLADGYAKIAEGEQALSEAQSRYDTETAKAREQLDSKKSELDQAQQAYDSGVADLNVLKAQYEQAQQAGAPEEQLEEMRQQIAAGEQQLAEKKALLDEGWQQYNAAVAQFEQETAASRQKLNEAEADLSNARSQVAQGEADLASARQQLEDGKNELADKEKDLEQGKKDLAQAKEDLADAEKKVADMAKYDWTVMDRNDNAGVGEISVFTDVTKNLSISMATLFVIVGLLVSYSAVSRIVHEQVTQIGTKKALGLRAKEITLSFLCYSGAAVLAGAIIGTIVGLTVVEGIIGSVLGSQFILGNYPPYFGLDMFLIMTLLELVLILGTTWLACRGILKKHAIELLLGSEPPKAKTRFYEKWGIWEKLPLFTQTIVNNCVNDKRRVFSTVVGVAGCTALIVTAITLNNDVLKSYDKHYDDVFDFNMIAFVESDPDDGIDKVETALNNKGVTTVQAVRQSYMVDTLDGGKTTVRMIVPMDADALDGVYHVLSTAGDTVDLSQDGAWVSQAYAKHLDAKVGDEITVSGNDGTEHHLKILGFYDFYLTHHEMVVGRDCYEREFGEITPNVVLANAGDITEDDLHAELSAIDGYDSIIDDKSYQHEDFETFSSVSSAVVAIYLALALLMAIVVLLNLNVMFIDEKKRELIVLMINGFSVKDAKRYIYNDSIVLTAIGIICGLVLGCIMGAATVAAVEPSTAVFVKDVDAMAVIVGIVGSAALATIMCVIALRRIPKFELTDINKF